MIFLIEPNTVNPPCVVKVCARIVPLYGIKPIEI